MDRRLVSTVLVAGALLAALAMVVGCSASRSTWTPCVVYDAAFPPTSNLDNSSCALNLRCVSFSTVGQDGMCHSIGSVCAMPCQVDADCSSVGVNATCSRACNSARTELGALGGVCTPFQ
jgi:hypothetical protein